MLWPSGSRSVTVGIVANRSMRHRLGAIMAARGPDEPELRHRKDIMAIDPALRRLALGTLLAAFPGGTAPGWALDLLADGLAGHTLFGTNVTSPEQVAALTRRAARGPAGRADRDRRGGRRRHPARPPDRQPVPGERGARRGRRPGAHPVGVRGDRWRPGRGRDQPRPRADRGRQHRGRQPDHRDPVVRRPRRSWWPGTPRPRSPASRKPGWRRARSTSPGTAPRSPTRTCRCPRSTRRWSCSGSAICRRSPPPSRPGPGRS